MLKMCASGHRQVIYEKPDNTFESTHGCPVCQCIKEIEDLQSQLYNLSTQELHSQKISMAKLANDLGNAIIKRGI